MSPDPILEFASQLRKSNEPDNMTFLLKNFTLKCVFSHLYLYVVRKIKAVRFWEFGKMVYTELLGVMMDEDYGDITDIAAGRDITVEVIPAAKETGKMYDTTTVRVKPVQSPLSKDGEEAEEYLENQKNA